MRRVYLVCTLQSLVMVMVMKVSAKFSFKFNVAIGNVTALSEVSDIGKTNEFES